MVDLPSTSKLKKCFDFSFENDFTHCQLGTLTLAVTPFVSVEHGNAVLLAVLVVSFTNILRAAFAPIFLHQKSTNPKS
jgi:hypothetical protein